MNLREIARRNTIDGDHDWGYQIRMVSEKEYCGKLLVLTNHEPGGHHYHNAKKETFIVLQGQVELMVTSEGNISHYDLSTGEQVTINPTDWHRMTAKRIDAVILEVSTHDSDDDTYYVD